MKKLLELVFPPKCVLCRRILERGRLDLCEECFLQAPAIKRCKGKLRFLDSWLALWHYEGKVRGSILRFKFYGKRHLAKNYGRLLAERILQDNVEFDLLTWVPVSRRRKLRRGYDQVAVLAKAVGRELGIKPVCCLRKVRHNMAQSTVVGQAQRQANVMGVYRVVHPERFARKRILLLDDVITTGATVSECARMLLTYGAEAVHCGAIAAARKEH